MKRIVTILFTVSLLCSMLAFTSLAADATAPEGAPSPEAIAKAMEAITGKNSIKDKEVELPKDSLKVENGVIFSEELDSGSLDGMVSWQEDALWVLTKKAKDGKYACIVLENVGKDTIKPLYFALINAEEDTNIDDLGAYLDMPILNGCSYELKLTGENNVWFCVSKIYNPDGKLKNIIYTDSDYRDSAAIKAIACVTDEKDQPVCGIVWDAAGQDYAKTGTGHEDFTVITFDPVKNTRFSYDTKGLEPDKASLKISTNVIDKDYLLSCVYLYGAYMNNKSVGDVVTVSKDCKIKKIADGSFAISVNGADHPLCVTTIVVKTDNGYTVINNSTIKKTGKESGFAANIENGKVTPIYIFDSAAEAEAIAKKQTSFYVKNMSKLFNASASVSISNDADGVVTTSTKAFDDNNKAIFSSEVKTYPYLDSAELMLVIGQNYDADGKPTATTYVTRDKTFTDYVFTNTKNGDSFEVLFSYKNKLIDLESIIVKKP